MLESWVCTDCRPTVAHPPNVMTHRPEGPSGATTLSDLPRRPRGRRFGSRTLPTECPPKGLRGPEEGSFDGMGRETPNRLPGPLA